MRPWTAAGVLGVLLLLGISGCDTGILDVDESGILLPSDLERAGPSAVPSVMNGVIGAYHEAVDDVVRYSALLTDEMILAGTFTGRAQIDARRIPVNSPLLEGSVYIPLHQARHLADTVAIQFQARLDDPDFQEVRSELLRGIARARLYGGLARMRFAEVYCSSIFTGVFLEAQPVSPDDRMRDALVFLGEAEARAASEGAEDIRRAARVARARAHLWLREFGTAAGLVESIPRQFVFWAEYSINSPGQYNEMYASTWGDGDQIRWTVGDGTFAQRGNEIWEHFDTFVRLGLIRVRPNGFSSFEGRIPVNLQTLYSRPEADILVASGIEARLIRAEAAVRAGQTQVAEDLLNDLRSDYSDRVAFRFGVEPPPTADRLQPLELTGNFQADLHTVSAERARELWLTGDRQATARRLRLDPQVDIDLFPPVKTGINGGDDLAFPIPQIEIDNNPNLTDGQACPAGQEPGFWR